MLALDCGERPDRASLYCSENRRLIQGGSRRLKPNNDRQSRRGLSAAACICSSRRQVRQVRGVGEIDMVSMAQPTLDLVTHDDAQPAFPAVHLEDRTVLSYGELAGLVGEFERVLRHDSKALVLCAGDRDLPTLLAYLAALRL